MKITHCLIPVFILLLVPQTPRAHSANDVSEQILKKEKVEIFTVFGNCNMCKQRIEGAIKDLPGIISAEWNVDSKEITVHYDPEEISLEEIHSKIAFVGHDTDKIQAENDVYNTLPGCCKYDRPKR